jgi:hypothetical protein
MEERPQHLCDSDNPGEVARAIRLAVEEERITPEKAKEYLHAYTTAYLGRIATELPPDEPA